MRLLHELPGSLVLVVLPYWLVLHVEVKSLDLGLLASSSKERLVEAIFQGDDEWGYAENCNKDYPKTAFSLKWHPKSIRSGELVTTSLSMISPIQFDTGNTVTDFYVRAQPDHPCLTTKSNIRCQDFKSINPSISCPINSHTPLKLLYTRTLPDAVPYGQFFVVGKLKTQTNQTFLCFNATIDIGP